MNKDTIMEQFKLKARLLKLLGEELIASQHLAVFELVKNAYDADATYVKVTIDNPSNKSNTKISILDDGCGMTLDTIKNNWLVIGTDNKEKMANDNKLSSIYHRFPLGAKGVGRFAAYKLGDRITLNTKFKNSPEYELTIDLDETSKNEFMDDIKLNITKVSKSDGKIKSESGTLITITKVRDSLSPLTIKKLNEQINTIVSPFVNAGLGIINDKNPFNVKLICNDIDETYVRNIEVTNLDDIIKKSIYRFDFSFEAGELRFNYNFCPSPILQSRANVKSRSESGKIKRLDIVNEQRNLFMQSLDDSQKLGKITGVFYVFDFGNDVLQYENDKKILKDYVRENYGIRIYRDGIRIYNYGIPGNDWLQLDLERINQPGELISNRMIIGAINLEHKSISVLREKTDRDGFIEDSMYELFRSIIQSIISKFTYYRNQDKEKLRLILKNPYDRIIDMENPIADLKKKLRENKMLETVQLEINKVEKAYNQMRNVMLNSGTALNAAITIHEIEKILFRIKSDISNKDILSIKQDIDTAVTLIEGISDLLKKDAIKEYSMRAILENVVCLNKRRFERHSIHFISPLLENKQEDATLKFPKRLITSAIINLIDNAIYWLDVRWAGIKDGQKKLCVNVDKIDDRIALIVADNGTGFPKGDWAELFRPFVTTKPMGAGMGLGLYFVKTIMDNINGEVRILLPEDIKSLKKFGTFDGAAIALIFKD